MNENLNLVQILKDCPIGTKLYSPALGEVALEKIFNNNGSYPIEVRAEGGSIFSFTRQGKHYNIEQGECLLFPSKDQRDWSKFKSKKPKQPKFNPKNLQPFDKVLARDGQNYRWRCTFYSHEREEECTFKYETACSIHIYCIPYNDETKHLVGTTEEAPEFYRYWEE